LRSQINPRSTAFAANTQRMQALLDEVNRLQAQVIAESESKRAKFEQRNQLLPRERLARLVLERVPERAPLIRPRKGRAEQLAQRPRARKRDRGRESCCSNVARPAIR
jgi:acetyl-CoA carboxylase carboxyltransferase component